MNTSSSNLGERFRKAGTSHLSVPAFCELLGLHPSELAEVACVHVDTLRSHPESVQLQAALRGILRLLSVMIAVEPEIQSCATFLKNQPISAFGNKTMMQLVKEGRTDDAIGFIESIGAGYVG